MSVATGINLVRLHFVNYLVLERTARSNPTWGGTAEGFHPRNSGANPLIVALGVY